MQKKHLQIISILCFIIGVAILIWTFTKNKPLTTQNTPKTQQQEHDLRYNTPLYVGDRVIQVEVADTQDKQRQGLSGRKMLEEGTGMIFTLDKPRNVYFWMPDMFISIDIIYIKDEKVVQIFDSVPYYPPDFPRENLPRYSSLSPVDLVLEVPAGWSKENNIDINSRVSLSKE